MTQISLVLSKACQPPFVYLICCITGYQLLNHLGTYLRVCFLDFSEAFDHIDHNILVCKLLKMAARSIVVKWICSFPPQRRQAVKLDGLLSEWATVHAGVPQGTKLGPVLFLVMVNDLACRSSYWKYFDDITISEVNPLGSPSTIQDDLDSITAWAEENCISLNPKKCKEMRLSFLAKDLDVLQLTVTKCLVLLFVTT